MARWRPTGPRVVMTDEELLEAAQRWWDMPHGRGRGDPVWEAWSAGFRAWCEEHDTDALELIRMRISRRYAQMKAECEARGEVWDGPDQPWPA